MRCNWVGLTLALALTVFMGCHPPQPVTELSEETAQTPRDVVQINREALKGMGITTFTVETQNVHTRFDTTGQIKADQDTVFHVASMVPGRIVSDRAVLGDLVRAGQVLATVQNVEVARVNAEYIHESHQNEIDVRQAQTRLRLAQQTLAREQQLYNEGVSPRKDYLQAQADVALAKSELEGTREHGVHIRSEAQTMLGAYGARLNGSDAETVHSVSSITSPRSGVVTGKTVTLGDVVSPEQTMYEITDLRKLWLDMVLYPKTVSRVKVGQRIVFASDSLPGQTFRGKVNYIQPGVAGATQTFVARAYLENPGRLLKPGMTGRVEIESDLPRKRLFVPDGAVQTYGKQTFVFKSLGNGRFRKQVVHLGETVAGGHLVKSGLSTGDVVVDKGSFTLKAELLKSQFAEEE